MVHHTMKTSRSIILSMKRQKLACTGTGLEAASFEPGYTSWPPTFRGSGAALGPCSFSLSFPRGTCSYSSASSTSAAFAGAGSLTFFSFGFCNALFAHHDLYHFSASHLWFK